MGPEFSSSIYSHSNFNSPSVPCTSFSILFRVAECVAKILSVLSIAANVNSKLLDNFVCSDTKLENLLFEVSFEETLK